MTTWPPPVFRIRRWGTRWSVLCLEHMHMDAVDTHAHALDVARHHWAMHHVGRAA